MSMTQIKRAGNNDLETSNSVKTSSTVRDKSVLFCEQCFRYDRHVPVKVSTVVRLSLIVLTCGLALIFWPKRCCCCGSTRF